MLIEASICGPLATNTYVVGCRSTGKAVIIDPAFGSFSFIEHSLKKHHLTAEAVWLTHSHVDHIGDLAAVKERFQIPVFVHLLDKDNVERPGSDGLPPFFAIVRPSVVENFIDEGDHLSCGLLSFTVLHTPGHTPGGVCFFSEKEKLLFSGDTLFKGTIGNLSFPGADPKKMWHSLKRLGSLPPETKVYPGHGELTIIGEEKFLSDPETYFG